MAGLLAGFPEGTEATNERAARARDQQTPRRSRRKIRCRPASTIASPTTHSFYARYLFSDGEVDTPDRTATARRVLAEQTPQNFVANFQSILGGSMVNEFKVGYNKPKTSAVAFANGPYDPIQVSLSGTISSSSIDARGTTGVARSGLLIRATSAASTTGSIFDPSSLSFSDTLTWSKGAHVIKAGGEYRRIQSEFQFKGSTEVTFNSVQDFIDNVPGRGGGVGRFAGVQAGAVST